MRSGRAAARSSLLPSSAVWARRSPARSCGRAAASVSPWSTPLASCTGCGWSSAASPAACLISASAQTENPRHPYCPCRPLQCYLEACVAFWRNSHCPGCSACSVWNPCSLFVSADAPRVCVAHQIILEKRQTRDEPVSCWARRCSSLEGGNSAVLSGAALLPDRAVRPGIRCWTTISLLGLIYHHYIMQPSQTGILIHFTHRLPRRMRLLHPPAVSALRCCLGLCNVERPTNPSIWCPLLSPPRLEILPLCSYGAEYKNKGCQFYFQ